MNSEGFNAFSEWFETNKYALVAEPTFEAEALLKLKCIHCQQGPLQCILDLGKRVDGTLELSQDISIQKRCAQIRPSKLQYRWIQVKM